MSIKREIQTKYMKEAYGYIQMEYKVSRQKTDKGSVNNDDPKLRKLTMHDLINDSIWERSAQSRIGNARWS